MFHVFHALQSESPVCDTIALQIRPLSQNKCFILMFEIIVYFILSLGNVLRTGMNLRVVRFRFVAYTECQTMLVPRPTLVSYSISVFTE